MDDHSENRPMFTGFPIGGLNPVLEVQLAHRSVRKYKEKPIPPEALNSILSAAQRAPLRLDHSRRGMGFAVSSGGCTSCPFNNKSHEIDNSADKYRQKRCQQHRSNYPFI